MKINRRKFVAGSAMAGLATTALAGDEKANEKVEWTCLVSWPTELDMLYSGATKIAENVKRMTNGNFILNLKADGSVNKDMDLLDAVSKGVAQCGHTASDYFSGRNSAMNFFTGMPFGLQANEHLAWLKYGGGQALSDKIYGKLNIKSVPAGNTGPQMGGWFNKKIEKIDDFKDVKFRIGGMGGQVLESMGAVKTSVPFLKLAEAIKSGELDAAEFVGPYDDQKLGLDQVAKYYYAPGWWQLGDQLELFINIDEYNKLPKAYQEILVIASLEANATLLSEYNYKNSIALEAMQKAGKVSLEQFPTEFLQQAFARVEKLHEENASKNPEYKAVYDSWKPFVDRASHWRNYIGKEMMTFK